VRLHDRTTHARIANGCAALPGGGFVSVSRDLRLHIWSDGSTRSFATPHRNSIKCCAVSDDGTLVATGDYAGRVGLFDLERSQYINISRLSAAGVSSLISVPGTKEFLATSYDGTVYTVGQVATHRLLAA
jgi:WD40 repeat protein